MWKNRTGHRRQYKTGHAQCMLCNKAADTHPEYVIPIYCFPRFTFILILPVLFP